jgi:hypothetical protein
MAERSDKPDRPEEVFVLTKVGKDGLTDEQIESIFQELGIEPAAEDEHSGEQLRIEDQRRNPEDRGRGFSRATPAWQTPGRQISGCLGPVAGWGGIFLLFVFLLFSAIALLRQIL